MNSFELAQHSPDKMFVNGVCSDTVGLYVDRPPMPPMASEKVNEYELPTQNGSVVRRTGRYDDITVTVKCFVFDGGYNPQDIYAFLSGAKTVCFSRSNDWFYKVKRVNGITPQYKQLGKNFLQVTFICEAFRYSVDNAPRTFSGRSFTVYNRGNVECEPLYRLEFDDASLIDFFDVNEERLQIQPFFATDTAVIYVDVAKKKVYSIGENGEYINQRYTSGRFWAQTLKTGWNTIETTEGILSVEITKNERWL
jgi:phage-related protein